MVKYFALNMHAVSPLSIRANHAQEDAETARYISGTTIAGSLAAVYRQLYPENTDEFAALFLSGQVQYPDLYPANFGSGSMQNATRLPVSPLPKTAQTCKRFPGFRYVFPDEEEVDEGSRHGVRDNLLDWALFYMLEQAGLSDPTVLLAPLQAHEECSCTHPLDRITGYYRRREQDGEMNLAQVKTRLQTHTGINRQTGTVQEGILYNRRVFEEGTRFWGEVRVSDALVPLFDSFLSDIGDSGLVRVGTARTRGIGKVNLGLVSMEDTLQRFRSFQKRLGDFNTWLHDIARETLPAVVAEYEGSFFFALTLHSPAILRDPLFRYLGGINEQVLAAQLNMPAKHFRLMHTAANSRRITGWNELWGTPKANDIAIETGSVFLFSTSLSRSELEQALFKLEEDGIGLRRSEGFGRVCVSDPIHREVKLR